MALKQAGDKRSKQGRSYSAPVILSLLILAKLAGETTPKAIADWVRLRSDWVKAVFGRPAERLPCANTYKYVCEKLDLVDQIFATFFEPVAVAAPGPPTARGSRHLALDGKTLGGTVSSPPTRRKKVHKK